MVGLRMSHSISQSRTRCNKEPDFVPCDVKSTGTCHFQLSFANFCLYLCAKSSLVILSNHFYYEFASVLLADSLLHNGLDMFQYQSGSACSRSGTVDVIQSTKILRLTA